MVACRRADVRLDDAFYERFLKMGIGWA